MGIIEIIRERLEALNSWFNPARSENDIYYYLVVFGILAAIVLIALVKHLWKNGKNDKLV